MTSEEAIKILTKINTDWVDRPKEQTEALDIAIEALTPESDSEVQAAERCVVELIREAHKRNNDSQYAHQEFIREYREELRSAEKMILAAIRAYRKQEPCEWCDPNGELYLLVTYATTNKDRIEYAKKHERPRYCCQCGQKLQEEQP